MTPTTPLTTLAAKAAEQIVPFNTFPVSQQLGRQRVTCLLLMAQWCSTASKKDLELIR